MRLGILPGSKGKNGRWSTTPAALKKWQRQQKQAAAAYEQNIINDYRAGRSVASMARDGAAYLQEHKFRTAERPGDLVQRTIYKAIMDGRLP